MALKKSEKAMVNNIARNVIVPVLSFYIAKYLNADFKTFFYKSWELRAKKGFVVSSQFEIETGNLAGLQKNNQNAAEINFFGKILYFAQ